MAIGELLYNFKANWRLPTDKCLDNNNEPYKMLFHSLSFFKKRYIQYTHNNIVVFLLELIEPNIEGNMRLKREVVQNV